MRGFYTSSLKVANILVRTSIGWNSGTWPHLTEGSLGDVVYQEYEILPEGQQSASCLWNLDESASLSSHSAVIFS